MAKRYNGTDKNLLPIADRAHDWFYRFTLGGKAYSPRERITRSIAIKKSVPDHAEEIIEFSEGVDVLYNAMVLGTVFDNEANGLKAWRLGRQLSSDIQELQKTVDQLPEDSPRRNALLYPIKTFYAGSRLIAGFLFLLHHQKAGTPNVGLHSVPATTLAPISPGSSKTIGTVPPVSKTHVARRALSPRPLGPNAIDVPSVELDVSDLTNPEMIIQASLERFLNLSH